MTVWDKNYVEPMYMDGICNVRDHVRLGLIPRHRTRRYRHRGNPSFEFLYVDDATPDFVNVGTGEDIEIGELNEA